MPRRPRLREVPEDDRQAPRQVPGLRQGRPPGRSRAGPGWSSGAAASTSPTTARTARARGRLRSEKPAAEKSSESKSDSAAKEPKSKTESPRPSRPRARAGEGPQGVSDTIRAELERVAAGFGADGLEFVLERPRDAGHGDLATNLAMLLARRERVNPREMAARVVERAPVPAHRRLPHRDRRPRLHQFLAGREPARRRGRRRSSTQGAAYGRATAGAGPQGQHRVRLRQSHRPAARRPRPGRRAGRRDRVAATSGPATRSPASSTSTTPASRSTGSPRASGPG